MKERFNSEWWSIQLPTGWSGRVSEETALLSAEGGPGLIQIRTFHSNGRDIRDDDLKELADFHVQAGAMLYHIRYGGGFTGFYVHYESEGKLWWEWWLRNGRLALHVTYHCPSEVRSVEEATVAAILNTLRYEGMKPTG